MFCPKSQIGGVGIWYFCRVWKYANSRISTCMISLDLMVPCLTVISLFIGIPADHMCICSLNTSSCKAWEYVLLPVSVWHTCIFRLFPIRYPTILNLKLLACCHHRHNNFWNFISASISEVLLSCVQFLLVAQAAVAMACSHLISLFGCLHQPLASWWSILY
jgi:hypothetical protein